MRLKIGGLTIPSLADRTTRPYDSETFATAPDINENSVFIVITENSKHPHLR